jgi:UDP-N-acetylmuramoyl-tripeptide--D-alanyl-D-alanine ligase
VLETQFRVRKNEGNYNNEIGVPLTILGCKTGGRSIIAWGGIFFHFLKLMVFRLPYPEVLVLEMGIDQKGDMDYLMSFAAPHIGVATHVSESHMRQFGTVANIAKEKRKLIKALPEDGFAILNADNEWTKKMKDTTKAKAITYGFSSEADIRVDNLLFHGDTGHVEGYSFKLNYKGKSVPVRLPFILAKHLIPSALAAVGVGVAMKLNLVEIAQALEGFQSLPGRMNMFPGIQETQIIDDTYNASPASTRAAIESLSYMQAPRKVAILGDMLELGEESDQAHASLASDIKNANITRVLLVGKHMQFLRDALLEIGYQPKQVSWYMDPWSTLEALSETLRPSDLILIKGSQGLRMELIVEALLAFPDQAERLLCRQSPTWKKIPFTPPVEWME